jgi:predicted permease
VFAVFVLRFALPLALFLGAVQTPFAKLEHPSYVACFVFGLMGTYLMGLCVGLLVFKHDLKTSTIQALACAFPDMAYFGAPVLAAVIGPEGFLAVLVGNLITSILMLPLTIVLTQIGEHKTEGKFWQTVRPILFSSILKALRDPIVWLPVLGILCSFAHIHLPEPVTASLSLMAKAAGGASLFALGLMFYGQTLRLSPDILANLGLKNFLQPGLMFLGILALGLQGSLAHQLLITGAIPTATAVSMFALRTKTYTQEATSTILISTLLGIVTEGLLILLLTHS